MPNRYTRDRDWHRERGVGALVGTDNFDRMTAFLSKAKPGSVVLDLGCGEGVASNGVAETYKHLKVFGIDCRPSHVGPTGLTHFVRGSMEDLAHVDGGKDFKGFADSSVGLVYACASFPYVRDKLKAIVEIWRVLKVGGQAVITLQPAYLGYHALEMFPPGSPIHWSDDFKTLVIEKTERPFSSLPCARFELVPLPDDMLGAESKVKFPDFLKFHAYRTHPDEYMRSLGWEECDLTIDPYRHARPSLYILPGEHAAASSIKEASSVSSGASTPGTSPSCRWGECVGESSNAAFRALGLDVSAKDDFLCDGAGQRKNMTGDLVTSVPADLMDTPSCSSSNDGVTVSAAATTAVIMRELSSAAMKEGSGCDVDEKPAELPPLLSPEDEVDDVRHLAAWAAYRDYDKYPDAMKLAPKVLEQKRAFWENQARIRALNKRAEAEAAAKPGCGPCVLM